MADPNAAKASRISYTPEERHILAIAPLRFLNKRDARLWLRNPDERHTIKLLKPHEMQPPGGRQSILAAATNCLLESGGEYSFARRDYATVSKAIRLWFKTRPPYTDAPRVDPDRGLSADQWTFLFNALTTVTYVDGAGNVRHHSSLAHVEVTRQFESTLGEADAVRRDNALSELDSLEAIKAASKLTLQTLQQLVEKRFEGQMVSTIPYKGQMVQEQELFKATRVSIQPRAAEQRLLGKLGMEEFYHSKRAPKVLVADANRISRVQTFVYKYKDDIGQTRTLTWYEGSWHLTGCLDGFCVHLEGALDYGARKVWRRARCRC